MAYREYELSLTEMIFTPTLGENYKMRGGEFLFLPFSLSLCARVAVWLVYHNVKYVTVSETTDVRCESN